jgi:hypothetical protein
MAIQTFSWQRRTTAWDDVQAWHTRMQAINDNFQTINDTIGAALADAQTGLTTGLATLAAKASITRMQNEAKAKAQAQSQVDLKV